MYNKLRSEEANALKAPRRKPTFGIPPYLLTTAEILLEKVIADSITYEQLATAAYFVFKAAIILAHKENRPKVPPIAHKIASYDADIKKARRVISLIDLEIKHRKANDPQTPKRSHRFSIIAGHAKASSSSKLVDYRNLLTVRIKALGGALARANKQLKAKHENAMFNSSPAKWLASKTIKQAYSFPLSEMAAEYAKIPSSFFKGTTYLINKVPSPKSINELRPITCLNTPYKILSTIILKKSCSNALREGPDTNRTDCTET
ncbi:hypothetical protein HZS_5504 [Henneguya salminicola]|nr:hypothetical protein HZS_5504 [Henneguya salminicola]